METGSTTSSGASRVWVLNAGARRAAEAYRVMSAQPNWVVRLALITFFIIIAIPVFILLLFATFAAVVVFAVGFAIHWIASKLRGERPSGRENVRVIKRVDDA